MSKKINLGKAFGDGIEKNKKGLGLFSSKRLDETTFGDVLIGVSHEVRDFILVSNTRVMLLSAFFAVTILFLLGRLVYVQLIAGNQFLTRSYYNSIRLEVVHPQRGVIYDRDGIVLARSKPSFRVAVDAGKIRKLSSSSVDYDEKQLDLLSSILKIPKTEIKNRIKDSSFPSTVTKVDKETTFSLHLHESELPAVSIEVSPVRDYSFGEAFGLILGYTGEVSGEDIKNSNNFYTPGDYIGKTGIEASFDYKLRGSAGKELVRVSSKGEKSEFSQKIAPVDGVSITLSLSSRLQKTLFDSIKAITVKYKAKGASAVAIDPRNGQILALASYPSYDNNLFAQGITTEQLDKLVNDKSLPMVNRAISGQYPPASTFKIITAAAALSDNIIDPAKELPAPASIQLGGITFRDWKDHGRANMIKAIAQSSDTYFYQIGGGYQDQKGVGPERIAYWARRFGLGDKTNIDLTGEEAGFIPTPEWKKGQYGENWYTGNTYNMSIGQGDVVSTPIQIAQFTSIIANGGKIFKPSLLKDDTSKLISENILSPEVIGTIKDGMKGAVEPGGTAWPLRDFRIKTGAKTGTSENQNDPHAIMTAFAPLDNPEIVVTVLVENGGQGSDVAGPAVRAAFEEWFKGR